MARGNLQAPHPGSRRKGARARASGSAGKHAEALAQEVRAQGYECKCQDSHSFMVWRAGEAKVLYSFPAHPKTENTLKSFRRELIKRGILPPRKEKAVAIVGAEQKRKTTELKVRLRAALDERGGDNTANRRKLIDEAIEAINHVRREDPDRVEQFGSTGSGRSTPLEIARQGLRMLLDQDAHATEKSYDRWMTALDYLDAQSKNGDHPAEPVEPVEPVQDPGPGGLPQARLTEPLPEAIHELRERVELAESVVADVEKERDEAKVARDKAEADLRAAQTQIDRLLEVREAGAAQKKATNDALLEAKKEMRSLRAKSSAHATVARRAQETLDEERRANEQLAAEMERRLEGQRQAYAGLEAELENHREASAGLREQFDAEHLENMFLRRQQEEWREQEENLLGTITELQIGAEVKEEYTKLLLAEVEASNGAPRPWVLERLDRLAGITTT